MIAGTFYAMPIAAVMFQTREFEWVENWMERTTVAMM